MKRRNPLTHPKLVEKRRQPLPWVKVEETMAMFNKAYDKWVKKPGHQHLERFSEWELRFL